MAWSLPRLVAAGRAALAIGLLVRPRRCASLVSFGGRCPAGWLIRLLGARMLLQACLELFRGSRRTLRLGAAVDALHAASMLAAAVRWPGYRRVALASAAVAGASAAVGLAGSEAS